MRTFSFYAVVIMATGLTFGCHQHGTSQMSEDSHRYEIALIDVAKYSLDGLTLTLENGTATLNFDDGDSSRVGVSNDSDFQKLVAGYVANDSPSSSRLFQLQNALRDIVPVIASKTHNPGKGREQAEQLAKRWVAQRGIRVTELTPCTAVTFTYVLSEQEIEELSKLTSSAREKDK